MRPPSAASNIMKMLTYFKRRLTLVVACQYYSLLLLTKTVHI